MEYRTLGRTGIRVSAIAFGAGPVSGWMDGLSPDAQCAVIQRALDLGINWFDTAAGYGNGQSEAGLGRLGMRRVTLLQLHNSYGHIMADCAAQRMGVFAIRVFAGGALLGAPPSAHTLKTPFFPLALYERDARRAGALAALLPAGLSMQPAALRFALAHPHVTSALAGFRTPAEVDQAVSALFSPPLPDGLLAAIGGGGQ
jgi:aryl-alcohol dehydrogenase-like predicted oxidoreductase